jgi:hypothetical protein
VSFLRPPHADAQPVLDRRSVSTATTLTTATLTTATLAIATFATVTLAAAALSSRVVLARDKRRCRRARSGHIPAPISTADSTRD